MALIADVPFLRLLIEQLRSQGIQDVILGTGYMAEKIEDYLGNGSDFGMHISYSREMEQLGTGGALKLAESQLGDPVFILNGDSYVEWNATAMLELLNSHDAQVVIALQTVVDVSRYGSVTIDKDRRITQFIEKGVRRGPGLINAGVYLVRKEITGGIPANQPVSLERDVFPGLLDRRVYGSVCGGLFIDIGIPDDLRKAQTLLTLRDSTVTRP